MKIDSVKEIFKGASSKWDIFGMTLPATYTTPEDEYMACRTAASLGIMLNSTPVYDVAGPDAAKLFNQVCVNRDFSVMEDGTSKHAIICNQHGHMLADGVVMKKAGDHYRTYWMAPVLQYYLEKSGLDVRGEYKEDEFFFQVDGPKSLEIVEEVSQCDLHDVKFARNKTVKISGADVVVHRLGMSGYLAYELHGAAEDAQKVYCTLREAVESHGGRMQGTINYSVLHHTPGSYPNQCQHFSYAYEEDGDADFIKFAKENCLSQAVKGSIQDEPGYNFVSPYDVGWGNLVNFNHEFMGKEALEKIAANPPRKAVTLEWNAQDVGEVFISGIQGKDVEPYDPIYEPFDKRISGNYVYVGDQKIGYSAGRSIAYAERRMISIGFIAKEYAKEGNIVEILWGLPGHHQKRIRATVAKFPYYDGEYRNETCDVEKLIPHINLDK